MNVEERNERLNEINNRMNSIYEEVDKLRSEKLQIELEGIDVIGKFLNLGERGYMFITHQDLDTNYEDNSQGIWLEGFYFYGRPNPYADSFFFECDAKYSMYIEASIFVKEYFETKEIYEITEEEFKIQYQELISTFNARSMNILEKCKKNLRN